MKLIRAMYGELSPWGRFWLFLGLVTLIAAALMSMDFGYSVSIKHALFLGCLSVVAAFAPDAAHQQWRSGSKATAIAIAAVCVPLLSIEFYSHAGYTAGLRGANVQVAKVQNVKYDDGREQVADNKANLDMWKKQLSKLNEDNGWVATVTADGLRTELDTANEAIRQEEARGGCGKRCMAKMQARDQISAKIAVAEQASDLTKRIEATQRLVDKYREASAHTEHKVSSVDLQNQFLAKAVALVSSGSLEPTEMEDASAEQAINLAMALAGTGLPAFALFIAGLYRIGNEREPTVKPRNAVTPNKPSLRHGPDNELVPVGGHFDSRFHITDERGVENLRKTMASHAERALALINGRTVEFAA